MKAWQKWMYIISSGIVGALSASIFFYPDNAKLLGAIILAISTIVAAITGMAIKSAA